MLTAEQKQRRLGKITSSLSAAVLGVDDDKSPIDAWLEIRGEGPSDDEMSPEMRKACERGNELESLVLSWGARSQGLAYIDAPFRVHADYDWLGDSTDGLYFDVNCEPKMSGEPVVGDGSYRVVEAKSVALGVAHHYGTEGTDEIKTAALIQSRNHLAHWPDAEGCDVPVIVGGYEFAFKMYHVPRDDEFERIMIDKLGEWHNRYIVGDRVPPATHRDNDTGYLRRRYAEERAENALDDAPKVREWAEKKAQASAKVRAAEKEEATAKNRLRELLGPHVLCAGDWGRVTWRDNKPSTVIDHEAIANKLLARLNPIDAESIIKGNTHEKPGNRPLNVNLSKALKKELGL